MKRFFFLSTVAIFTTGILAVGADASKSKAKPLEVQVAQLRNEVALLKREIETLHREMAELKAEQKSDLLRKGFPFDDFFEDRWHVRPFDRFDESFKRLHEELFRARKELKKEAEDFTELPLRGRSMIHVNLNGREISIVENAEGRFVTVREQGEVIAENLPWEKRESLPEDLRQDVESLVAKNGFRLNFSAPKKKLREKALDFEVNKLRPPEAK